MIYKTFDKHHPGFSSFLSRSKKMLLHGEIYQCSSFFFFFIVRKEKSKDKVAFLIGSSSVWTVVLSTQMFCITVLLASCTQYAISLVILLIQDMRQIFLIKFMNVLEARKQIISPTAAHIRLSCRFLIYFFYIKQPEWSWF